PGDGERLANWLESKVPARAGAALVADFVKYDPVRATPEFLSRLLDHDRVTIRNAAYDELAKRVDAQALPAVANALESKRASTRRKAIDLIGSVDDPAVLDLLLSRLTDPNARVANDVVERLASLRDDRVEIELLSRAFGERWILRGSAYALLAILQREDTKLEPILTHNHVPALLEGMRANDPFVSGASAAALAGIGFRSQDPAQSSWLETRVPEALVSAVSGQVYHDDFSSLQPVAQNRLRLLSGQALGSSGPKWVEWWLANKDNFYPHRAFVPVAEEDEPRISILFREQGLGQDADAFELIGSAVAEERAATPRRAAERLFLTETQSRALVASLRREGVFGAQRLPGMRGRRGSGTRSLMF
ncbi:MAG: HEAT repeat domain-containing protein, partial [Planctomycetota bacterium]